MKLSQFTRQLKPSETLAISTKAKTLRAQGRNIVDFGLGEPDFATPGNIIRAAEHAMAEGFTKYTPPAGLPALRRAIAEKLKRENGLDYAPEQVIVSCGAKQALYNVAMVLIDAGDEVLIPGPYWVTYPTQVILAGGIPVILPTTAAEDFKITPEMLRRAITPRTRGIILNSPCNPTGVVYSPTELAALANVLAETDLFIITDEIYEHIIYDGLKQVSIATLHPALKERTIVVNGFSKAYSMTGWRLGYCAGPRDVIEMCDRLQSQTTSNPTAFAQVAGIEALTGPQESVQTMAQAFEERRNFVVQRLNAIPGIRSNTPQGAFYIFPQIDGLFGKRAGGTLLTTSAAVADYLLEAAGVAVVPGDAFGDDHYMRISYASSMAELEDGLARIDRAVQQLV
ncbi:MAG: pyridoxal phosphate-dependent aminotransferase [Candidatus Tectomicrobia bacterium]|uniref:Aminotransferase n=1 Tax=Tectimicrobiota bacterium TaxID=2528274 RepID=A0A937W1R8_UNCTE|nr:pyridoxal phosphate-dependent aminotransferase [Candidatus Tectomicrobia bacterium]